MMNKKYFILVYLLVAQFILQPVSVFAQLDTQFYSGNNVLFSDPFANRCGPGETLAESDITFTNSPTTDTIFDFLTSTELSTNANRPLNNVQAAGVMGNMYAESAFKSDKVEATEATSKGHGLLQWTNDRWENLQEYASERDLEWSNLQLQLLFLESELESTESAVLQDEIFSTTEQPSEAAIRFTVIFEQASPVLADDDTRVSAAIAILNLYGGSDTSNCISGDGVVAGNLVETIINFALEEPADLNGQVRNTEADARDTYREAKPRLNPAVDWTDCGGLIATVMYATKVDPEYPSVWVPAQINYVKNNPDKYLVLENPSIGDLVPGDILLTPGHTTMYTGKSNYPSVDASYTQRVPSVRNAGSAVWMINNGAIVARVIQ